MLTARLKLFLQPFLACEAPLRRAVPIPNRNVMILYSSPISAHAERNREREDVHKLSYAANVKHAVQRCCR
jgi:hypothetical protein